MSKVSPYWILNPLINNLDIKEYKNWSFFNASEIINGFSPLENLGKEYYNLAQNRVSLYDHCLWIFYDKKFEEEESFRFYLILKSVSETFCNSLLSQTGRIIQYNTREIIKQPATPAQFDNLKGGEKLSNEKIIRILNITEILYYKNLADYISIFEYLSEVKKSSYFIKELALWSFIEQHWLVNKNSKNKLAESLKKLGLNVYDKSDVNYVKFKENLKTFIKSFDGNESNLSDLRNYLAHGTFYKEQHNWRDNQTNLFFSIHEFLFEMVLLGLEKEIILK